MFSASTKPKLLKWFCLSSVQRWYWSVTEGLVGLRKAFLFVLYSKFPVKHLIIYSTWFHLTELHTAIFKILCTTTIHSRLRIVDVWSVKWLLLFKIKRKSVIFLVVGSMNGWLDRRFWKRWFESSERFQLQWSYGQHCTARMTSNNKH